MHQVRHYRRTFRSPPALRTLLTDPRASPIWLVVRLYLGWQWLSAGGHKLAGPESIGWVHGGVVNGKTMHAGDRLHGFWQHAIAPAQPGSMPQVGYGWYRDFLRFLLAHHAQTVFAPLIAWTEFAVGLLLIFGAFTAVAAGVGALLNFNYMLAGSASINPVLFLGALLILAAWRVAGWLGLDHWLLPALGTPWQPGWLLHRRASTTGVPTRHTRHGRPPVARPSTIRLRRRTTAR